MEAHLVIEMDIGFFNDNFSEKIKFIEVQFIYSNPHSKFIAG